MQRNLGFVFIALFCVRASAAVEDGAEQCSDGVDNDFDGIVETLEPACISSMENYGLLPGPISVGLGAEKPYAVFDIAMATTNGSLYVSDALVLDVNGPTTGRDDVIVPQPSSMRLLRNYFTPGYASLPISFSPVTGFLPGGPRPRYAAGDLSGDGIADLVGMDGLNTQRFIGNGNGGFAPLAITGGTGLPAIIARTAVVASARLRLYDQRCTVAPAGFPAGETFVAGSLCASVAIAAGAPRLIETGSINGRNFVLTVTGSTVNVHEIVVTYTGANVSVNAVLRNTTTIANVVDVAWSTPGGGSLFVFALTDTLAVRRMSTAGVLSTLPIFQDIIVDPTPPPDRQPIGKITIGQFKAGEYSVVITEEKTENFRVLPYSTTTGWKRADIVLGLFDSDGVADNQLPSDVVVGQFNDDSLLDIGVLDRNTGNFIIVRQQPAPCISFITSASHGLLGSPSYTPTARFNRLLAEQMVLANSARRPASGFRDNQNSSLPAL